MSMFDLSQLSEDDLAPMLFDALVERFDAKAHEDPSIALVNRMPTVLSVSRRGNLLTLSQGSGLWLLRGDLKWQDRHERVRTFNVGRAPIQSRLAITPDGITGTPDEILDWIVTMFLEWTATGEESRPAVPEPVQESPTARVQQERPTPATSRTIRESRPAAVEVTEESSPRPQMADKASEAAPPPPRPAPIRALEKTTPTLRTYQLLFETTRRELYLAEAAPTNSGYSLIGAGVFVALTAEAFFNDLGARVIPSWSQLQRLDPREKAEVLSIELFNVKVDWSIRPFQSVAAALGFRRALAHAHAETLSFEEVRTADGKENEVPRTRRTAWREHCDVATIQRWITDVGLLIEHFSRGHDPTEVAVGMVERPSVSSSDDTSTHSD
jgi:hypothetical protein